MFQSSSMRTRRSSSRAALRWVAIVVGVVALVVLLVAGALWLYANSKLDEIDVPALDGSEQQDTADGEVGQAGEITDTLNVLVVGNDTREGLTEQQLQELGTTDEGTRLTDTIMLVQIAPQREKAVVVAFPRDLAVTMPGVSGAGENDYVKINSVMNRGDGPDALVEVIEDFTELDLDHYVEVNMAGFLQLADALGGVEVCLDEPLVDEYAGVDLPGGCQTLDSTDALGFVRSRRTPTEQFGAGDFGRIAKQQYYLQQAMDEATQVGTLVNPLRVKNLIDAVASAVTTDRALGLTDMYRIANTLRDVTADDVLMRTVPGTIQTIGDQSFVVHEPGPTTDLFAAMREGGDLGELGTEAPDELAPDDVRVLIVNGVGTEGLAGDVQAYLEDRGFTVTDAVNPFDLDPDAEFDTSLERLTIEHTADGSARAELLLDHLGDVPVDLEEVDPDALPDGADVVLVVGSGWEQS